ncbi:hypothetical protein ACHAWF_016554 [Thalassiosira exigua]
MDHCEATGVSVQAVGPSRSVHPIEDGTLRQREAQSEGQVSEGRGGSGGVVDNKNDDEREGSSPRGSGRERRAICGPAELLPTSFPAGRPRPTGETPWSARMGNIQGGEKGAPPPPGRDGGSFRAQTSPSSRGSENSRRLRRWGGADEGCVHANGLPWHCRNVPREHRELYVALDSVARRIPSSVPAKRRTRMFPEAELGAPSARDEGGEEESEEDAQSGRTTGTPGGTSSRSMTTYLDMIDMGISIRWIIGSVGSKENWTTV